MSGLDRIEDRAPLLLGGIRLFNGLVALLAPSVTARRLGTDPDANPTPFYPLRMFGVRTVVLGAELLWGSEETRLRSMRIGRAIHASDAMAATIGGLRGQIPGRVALLLTGISTVNTALAFLGSKPRNASHKRSRGLRTRL